MLRKILLALKGSDVDIIKQRELKHTKGFFSSVEGLVIRAEQL
jgi:hypothetical protein